MEAAVQKPKKRSNVFTMLVVGALILFVIFALANRETMEETYQLLLDIEPFYVLLLPIIQALNYLLIGNYYRTMFARFDVKIHPARAWGVVAAMNFVNQVLPSGGLSGISYLAYGFHAKISSGKTTLIQIGRYIGAFGSYALMSPLVIVALLLQGDRSVVADIADRVIDNPVALVSVILFFVFSLLLFLGFRSEAHTHRFSGWVIRTINAVSRPFRKTNDDLITQQRASGAVKEFHEGVAFFRASRTKVIVPLLSMSASTLLEMAIVYVSLLAVGADVALTTVFIAFAAANVAGVVSVVPGDVGVHEAVIIFVLGAFGVPVSVALSATLLYRVFNKIIFLPIGFYFYTQFLRPATK